MINLHSNLRNIDGVLHFGGRNMSEIAEKYGTPLYVMDEQTIRANCRTYVRAMKKYFGESSYPCYASKACCFKDIYRIIGSEGMSADCVSCGEIYTAKSAGFDMSKIHFHSNSKNDYDINYAIDAGVGYFVVDNLEELFALNDIAGKRNIRQKILLRLTPGIDTHTYEAVRTGNVDSKFGFPIETGAAQKAVKKALACENIELKGYHCHIGSQLFDSDVFIRAADIMIEFTCKMRDKFDYVAEEIDLGGGYGVRYHESDPIIDIENNIRLVADRFHKKCRTMNITPPAVILEPGRSIVADAGITLYTVGNVKRIEGYKNYVAVDGGMGDNPRNLFYGSTYSVLSVDNLNKPATFLCDLVGRFCESGDVVTPNISLPEDVKRGDKVAVLTTGAYNFSMASNYNRYPRPAVIMIDGDTDRISVRQETIEDVISRDN
jgi:diaminopimelate decarboxylase